MKLALFDLDNTLLDGDSDHAWAEFLIEEGVLHPADYHAKNEWFYERYKDGTLDIHEFLDFQLAPIANRPRAQLDAWHADFMQRKIRPSDFPFGTKLTITGNPMKDGRPGAMWVKAVRADGKVFYPRHGSRRCGRERLPRSAAGTRAA